MSTIQIRVDDELKKSAYQAFEKLNLSPSDALRLFLRYVAENEKLPFQKYPSWSVIKMRMLISWLLSVNV